MRLGKLILLMAMVLAGQMTKAQNTAPKREFRGAWIATVNGQFMGMSTDAMQQSLIERLNVLQKAGINAVIFQVRPESDALYKSDIEPWSRFLTGTQGKPPYPMWDPMDFMIRECHKRGIEFHAWINPYRARMKTNVNFSPMHPYVRHPERFITYGGQLFYDPGLPENRQYICSIVKDIVTRYDVDAIHMDDYFYPYPVAGEEFNDHVSFARYGRGYGNRGDWRRDNVNRLIKDIHETVRETKPWVKFGVSPFGIYRNAKSDRNGSATNGLQCYDDLYADVLKWIDNGWIDYNIPQLYWEMGHRAADYTTLIKWWNEHASKRPLYIGEDVLRTVKYPDPNRPDQHQQQAKMNLSRSLLNVQGNCMWYAEALTQNPGNYLTMLERDYYRYPALPPRSPFIDSHAPKKVKKLKPIWTMDGYILFWTAPKAKTEMDKAVRYVVYRFAKGERVRTDDPSRIVAVTPDTFIKLPYEAGKDKYTYVVTALDRLHNESGMKKKQVKL